VRRDPVPAAGPDKAGAGIGIDSVVEVGTPVESGSPVGSRRP